MAKEIIIGISAVAINNGNVACGGYSNQHGALASKWRNISQQAAAARQWPGEAKMQ